MKQSKVASEITGKVWKITSAPGDKLAEDDPILILESMKMEIPLTAPRAGVVLELLVAEGEGVSEGQTVVVLE